jgi:hypothetical protein
MPAMRWAGRTWHIPTDAMPFLAAIQLLLNGVWLILYFVLLLLVTRPHSECDNAAQAISWGLMSFLLANCLTALVLMYLGSRGTPLTPSRRSLVPVVIYWDVAKYTAMLGFVIWGLVYTRNVPAACWSGQRTRKIEILLWCTLSVFVLMVLFVVIFWDGLASKPPDRRWRVRVKMISRLLGCYKASRLPMQGSPLLSPEGLKNLSSPPVTMLIMDVFPQNHIHTPCDLNAFEQRNILCFARADVDACRTTRSSRCWWGR